MARAVALVREYRSGWIPIERLLPVMERFASFWGANIFACLGCCHEPSVGSDDVLVHFFCGGQEYRNLTLSVDSVFGYPARKKLASWVTPAYGYQPNQFRDFRGELISHVYGRSIVINVDFLSSAWEGQEDVLSLILFTNLPAILGYSSTQVDVLKNAGKAMAGWIKDQAKNFSYDSFQSFLGNISNCAINTHLERFIGATKRVSEIESELIILRRKIIALEEYLKWLPERLPDEVALADIFDAILRFKGVKRVRMETGKVVITTQRIKHCSPPTYGGSSAGYDVGSFDIFVELMHSSRYGVVVIQKEEGQYQHHYYSSQAGGRICFGTVFNPLIDKMMAEVDVLSVLTLVLTFLREVEGVPNIRFSPAYSVSGGESETDLSDPGLAEEEYAKSKSEFVALIRKVFLEKLGSEAQSSLLEARSKGEALSKEYLEGRRLNSEQEKFLRFLKEDREPSLGLKYRIFRELIEHPFVAGVEIVPESGLRIWLYAEDRFPYPLLLWIGRDAGPRLISHKECYGRNSLHSLNFTAETQEEVTELIAKKKFSDVVQRVLELISPPQNSSSIQSSTLVGDGD